MFLSKLKAKNGVKKLTWNNYRKTINQKGGNRYYGSLEKEVGAGKNQLRNRYMKANGTITLRLWSIQSLTQAIALSM